MIIIELVYNLNLNYNGLLNEWNQENDLIKNTLKAS